MTMKRTMILKMKSIKVGSCPPTTILQQLWEDPETRKVEWRDVQVDNTEEKRETLPTSGKQELLNGQPCGAV